VPWVAGLGNRGGKTVGVLVGRRTSEGGGGSTSPGPNLPRGWRSMPSSREGEG
jgi:hypothetical protein